MAKSKKTKKSVAEGIAHIHSHLTIQSSQSPIKVGMQYVGEHQEVQDLEGQGKALHLLHRLLRKELATLQKKWEW